MCDCRLWIDEWSVRASDQSRTNAVVVVTACLRREWSRTGNNSVQRHEWLDMLKLPIWRRCAQHDPICQSNSCWCLTPVANYSHLIHSRVLCRGLSSSRWPTGRSMSLILGCGTCCQFCCVWWTTIRALGCHIEFVLCLVIALGCCIIDNYSVIMQWNCSSEAPPRPAGCGSLSAGRGGGEDWE